MASDKFIMFNLDDERSKDIADVLGNKTCKKILDYLSEVKEASEKDISDALNSPINTVEYNLNKLIKTGLIEKTKNFFWSVKGRKIDNYKLSNKKIVISPKSFSKGIVPALIGIALVSFGIKVWSDKISNGSVVDLTSTAGNGMGSGVISPTSVSSSSQNAAGSSSSVVSKFASNIPLQINNTSNPSPEIWAWFLLGGLIVILIFLLFNQFKIKKFSHENFSFFKFFRKQNFKNMKGGL